GSAAPAAIPAAGQHTPSPCPAGFAREGKTPRITAARIAAHMLPAKKSFFHPDFCLTYNISYLNVSNIRQRTVLHERCILLTFATAIQATRLINALIIRKK
ncbi:hypothetical protein, partial [Alistipes sp.]|uniref:hypothetical protein n=1 Tax=Alistipes sp. TaxID=1872444 RepID=UPI00283E0EBD